MSKATRPLLSFRVDEDKLSRLRIYCASQPKRTTMQDVVEPMFNELVEKVAPKKRKR